MQYRPGQYRIGDVIIFNGRLMRDDGVVDLQRSTLASHPDSIAAAFVVEAHEQNFTDACFDKLDQCASILKKVTDRKCPGLLEAFRRTGVAVAPVVVHVRTADVIDKSGENNNWLTGHKLEFYEKLAAVLRERGFGRVTLMTSYKFNTADHTGPKLFMQKVQKAFEGIETNVLVTDDADTDFCTMISAPVFVPSRSGMSEVAAENSLLNGNEVIGLWRRDDPASVALGIYNPGYHHEYQKMNPMRKPGWFEKIVSFGPFPMTPVT
jgi:hypothetical protein